MGHQKDQTQVDESSHEDADGRLCDPILNKSIEEAWTEQRGHHREHKKRNREDQRQDRAHGTEHRARILARASSMPPMVNHSGR